MQEHKEINLPDDEASKIEKEKDKESQHHSSKKAVELIAGARGEVRLNANHHNYFINMMMYSNL